MYQTIFLASGLLIASLFNHTHAQEPTNLNVKKQALIRYFEKGEYRSDLQLTVNKAKKYLALRVMDNNKKAVKQKLAIVLDIDETTLTLYPCMKKHSFGGTLPQVVSWVNTYTLAPIKPMHEFYQFAKANKVSVFFVSGRKPSTKLATIKNLKKSGYDSWSGLYFKPENYAKKSVIPYKAGTRKLIEAKGYKIIESIGDQLSDLKGGYAEKTYKLPNPFYFIP